MAWSIEAVVKLLLAELGQLGHVHIAMEGVIGVQSIPVLRAIVVSLQDGIGMPALAVEVRMVGRVPAPLGVAFLGLEPFVGLAIGWIEQWSWWFEGLVGGGPPIGLSKMGSTFHPGCARWISVLPYLLLEAIFELSISASLFRLNPVEERPKVFLPSRSFWKLCFAIAEYPLAWIFSALTEGIYPLYPGIAVFFGYIESLVRGVVLCCGSGRRMICTCCFGSIFGSLDCRWFCCECCLVLSVRNCSLRPFAKSRRFARSFW